MSCPPSSRTARPGNQLARKSFGLSVLLATQRRPKNKKLLLAASVLKSWQRWIKFTTVYRHTGILVPSDWGNWATYVAKSNIGLYSHLYDMSKCQIVPTSIWLEPKYNFLSDDVICCIIRCPKKVLGALKVSTKVSTERTPFYPAWASLPWSKWHPIGLIDACWCASHRYNGCISNVTFCPIPAYWHVLFRYSKKVLAKLKTMFTIYSSFWFQWYANEGKRTTL